MLSAETQVLHDAIDRNLALVLSLPSAGMLRHQKSRFLANAGDEGFWIEYSQEEAALIAELIRTQQPCGVSFKSGNTKVVFGAPLVRTAHDCRVNATMCVPALLVSFPKDIKASQRRSDYRVAVPTGEDLSVRLWRVSEQANLKDTPMAAQEIEASLKDISVGGMRVSLKGKDGDAPRISTEDRLRIQITYGETPLILEGQMRFQLCLLDPKNFSCGIQFKALQQDLEGRRIQAILTRIVGELQRAEARRHRMSVTMSA